MIASNNLIKALGRQIGLDSLALDDNGQCTLSFDDAIVLTFVADAEDGLNVVSYVGELSDGNPSAGARLLARNFVPNGLGGGRVAVEPGSNRVVLVNRWDGVRTDNQTFSKQLEAFVDAVEAVRADLESPASASAQLRTRGNNEELPPPGAFA